MAENEIDVYNEILLSNNIRSSGSEYEQSWDGKTSKINMPTSIFEDVVDTAGDVVDTVGDFATGVVKGMPQGASKAGTEIMDTLTGQWFSETAVPWMNENIPGLDTANTAINETIKYDGTAQEIGGMIGEVGTQIIAPGALATKGLQGANLGSRFLTNVLGYGATEALVIPAKDKGLIETAITLISKDSEASKAVLETLEADEDLPYLMQKLQRSPLLLLEGGVIGEGIAEGLGLLIKYGKNSPMLKSLKSGVKSQFQKIGEKAQRELDLDTGGTSLSSMGAGELNTALNTHLAKLAKNREQATRKVDNQGFYSQALEEANNLKQEKGTGQQYKAMLLKAGVKQDEIDWSGLDEVLSKDKVTKQEIVDQLEANKIELEEVEKVGSEEVNSMDWFYNENAVSSDDLLIEGLEKKTEITESSLFEMERKLISTMRADDAFGSDYLYERADEIYNDFEPDLLDTKGFTKDDAYRKAVNEYYANPVRIYEDSNTGYVITGNDDLGYSIFKNKGESTSYANAMNVSDGTNEYLRGNTDIPYSLDEAKVQAQNIAEYEGDVMFEGSAGRYEDYTVDGGTNYREFLITYGRQGMIQNKKMRETDEYMGPHFDEENIIAHFRTKDRTYGDKQILYVEEIQSDWGQQGRKQGFQKSEQEMANLTKDINAGKLTDEAEDLIVENNRLKPPKAPFVTDTNKWTALSIKRILAKASEEGYDAVAITPGKVHVDRWNVEGLGNYYDNIVPKIAKQVVGKLGGSVRKLPSSKDVDLRDTPSGDTFGNMEAFDEALFIDLTPQVKDKAKKGQALFAVPAGATAVGVSQQENNGANDG